MGLSHGPRGGPNNLNLRKPFLKRGCVRFYAVATLAHAAQHSQSKEVAQDILLRKIIESVIAAEDIHSVATAVLTPVSGSKSMRSQSLDKYM